MVIFILLSAAFYYVVNLLYRPIYEVLQPHIEKDSKSYDEFQILNDNLAKMQSLNHSLMATRKTTNTLLAQQYYQNLLTDPNGYLAPKKNRISLTTACSVWGLYVFHRMPPRLWMTADSASLKCTRT
ncbi:hypothetical protein LC724_17950 [Blautia sp. RD014234]|nr:hypothetical protein [Blautia parvula]